MRADLSVASRPVVSVVLSDIQPSLTHTLSEIRGALTSGKLGLKNVSKDFLSPGCSDTSIARNINSKRRKCEVIFLDMLDTHLSQQIHAGGYLYIVLGHLITSNGCYLDTETEILVYTVA